MSDSDSSDGYTPPPWEPARRGHDGYSPASPPWEPARRGHDGYSPASPPWEPDRRDHDGPYTPASPPYMPPLWDPPRQGHSAYSPASPPWESLRRGHDGYSPASPPWEPSSSSEEEGDLHEEDPVHNNNLFPPPRIDWSPDIKTERIPLPNSGVLKVSYEMKDFTIRKIERIYLNEETQQMNIQTIV